jgi:F-type H+-transporting ATPase subunit b
MQIVSNVALITINETFLVQLLSFLIFLFIINRIMFRPLRRVMQERTDYIDKVKKDMVEAEQEINAVTQKIKAQETEAIQAANGMRYQLEEEGAKEAAAILTESRLQVEQLRKETERDVGELVDKARQSLQGESEKLAGVMIETILDRRLAQ